MHNVQETQKTVSDLNVLGQSPRHNMWLLQYILYRILLFNTDCYNTYYVE